MEYRDTQPADVTNDTPEGRSNRVRFIVLGLVVALALGYMIYAAFPGNALYFLTVSEFNEKTDVHDGRMVRVSGQLIEGTFERPGNSTLTSFQLTDKDGAATHSVLDARYVGVLPDLFFNPHSEIILEGSYGSDQVFEADSILVKCPSKYRDLEEEQAAVGPKFRPANALAAAAITT